ncbi:MAG: sulfatase [Kordiimonadaceae bacterium]|jgi:arylsulfatase A|nr:sulfatase [Kordiimonadaceae bacterium]MBT6036253.1 sulfatase [Kordiimonadaceae bacterium]MBT6330437.1 sulfatase [Kordiimonadaceae bacterium]MBT7582201.1 sulfatase [Kordiimonadaceae bacterium]
MIHCFEFSRWLVVIAILASSSFIGLKAQAQERPNFVVIFTDDQGYGDLGSYGSPDIRTPNIDDIAAEGMTFTSFYAAVFCGPSRAALMTASYPPRNALDFNHFPNAKTGINSGEVTIAEMLKEQGYATIHLGKWHLGDVAEFMPLEHGFDEYFGIPYSNDMWRFHDAITRTENSDPRLIAAIERANYTGSPDIGHPFDESLGKNDLPLYHNSEIIEYNPDQTLLTKRYTEHALDFIEKNKDGPFFLYLAHAMPHMPIFASEKFKGKSIRGLYGDTIEEIDWGVGEIIAKLKELGIDDNTVVVFTSDNGPWLQYGIDAGSAGPLRDGKATVYEGGIRVPGIVRWPGKIPAGARSSEIVSNMDLMPTFAHLAGADLPSDRVLDGRNIWDLLSGKTMKGPHNEFYYYGGNPAENEANLMAVRQGRWKLHFKKENRRAVMPLKGVELYDLHRDVSEKYNRSEDHPDVVARLEQLAKEFNASLIENIRPLGRVAQN